MKKLSLLLFLVILTTTATLAQENDGYEKSIKFKLKDAKNLVVYIDGKKYDPDIVELLDTEKIATVTVLKGEEAMAKYNAPDGVILITSKKDGEPLESLADDKYPMVILDGQISTRDEVAKLDPNQIDSIEVLKGEKAMKKHNAPNGVIIIKTKEKD